ncbi:FadR/GntR family transcriptional regulator [Micromonospora sp. AKA38]|uniref:FadR/GntR family transcriptional regulator n=1 Tax=Micromonospora sp. AKA38 TaxID=2733861 RepID=UPI00248FADDE|nr:FadR/GntR family transcriptional regulator [Micromonospora sp. AKA38]
MSVEPAVPRGLHGQVVHTIGLSIVSGDLAAGEQIVPEEIGARYGVSRPVVREALRVLESKGMVAARPKTGTRVLPVERWNLLDHDVILWRVQGPGWESQLRDLLDLRAAVEPMAARRCAESSDDTRAKGLADRCDEMEQAVRSNDSEAFTRADIEFHTLLLAGAGNRVLAQISGAIEAALKARESLHLMPDHLGHEAVSSHRLIVDAIAGADPDRAEAAARALIQVAGAEITERLTHIAI